MFPFDRFGAVHITRVIIEILLLIFLHIFGTCRLGIIFGFNDVSSILFYTTLLLMASTDIYHLLLSIFSSLAPRRAVVFHMIFYSCMSLLALGCCVFAIVAFIFCLQDKHNRLCPYRSCGIHWIGISLTFILSILYSASAKLLCCLRGDN